MSRCEKCDKPLKRGGVCSECVAEFQSGMERARAIWAYSEPRILDYEGEDWRTVREEGYNLLLFNLLYLTRRSKYVEGRRVRTNVGHLDYQRLAESITSSRATINNNRFLHKRYLYLKDAGYISEGDSGVILGDHDPHISL